MDDCLQRLIEVIDTKEDLQNLIPSHRVAKLVRIRLEMQAPYISKWPQALSIQVHFISCFSVRYVKWNFSQVHSCFILHLGTTLKYTNELQAAGNACR